jgi:hypothetical protein
MAEAVDIVEVTTPENPVAVAVPEVVPIEGEEGAEQAVEGATEGEEGEKAEEGDENGLPDDKGRGKKHGVQARIDELTRGKRDAERRAEYYERLATANTAQDPAEGAAKPTVDQFEDYADFVEAIAGWSVAQSTKTLARDAAQGAAQNERKAHYAERLAETRATIADFDAVMEAAQDITVAPHVADAVLDSERGPEIFYHMAQHPEFAERLNGLSPTRAAMEIGRIEAQLTAPAGRRQSQAPAPITPLATGSTTKVNLNTADMATYIEERKRQGARFR